MKLHSLRVLDKGLGQWQGGIESVTRKIHNQDEVEITNDYLKELSNGKLLDAGCGLGDSAMYFEEHGFL